MNEFIQAFAALLNGFPAIILLFLAPIGGALMVTIVAALLGEIQTPGQFLGRVVVGTVTGWFCSSLVAPIVKSPPVTVGFLSGASGYWFMSKYLRKKQDEIMNKPPDDGQKPQ